MRINSGKYKGRVIEGFSLEGTRPTMERVKESLFAMLQNKIDSSIVLDLFAGSGNLGIEALSEGASYAYFVDNNKKAIKTIENNLKKLNINNATIILDDYQKALKKIDKKIDIVFLDPPYKTNYIETSINEIEKNNILNIDGLIVCESDTIDKIIFPEKYQVVKEKKYGDKFIVIIKKIC